MLNYNMKIKFTIPLLLLFSLVGLFAFDEVKDVFEDNPMNCDDCFSISDVSFSQVGPVGGGFPNVVSWDPNVEGTIYYGSDVGGTGKSINDGRDFVSAARGLGYQTSHDKIAALNAVDINGSTVIVGGTGFRTGGGEVISSVDGGETWTDDSSASSQSRDVSFSAQNSAAPLPTGRPRSTDPGLIQWISGSTWVAGTYDNGIWITYDDRKNWSRLDDFVGDVHVRTMVISPSEDNTFYVGLWGDASSIENKGLWRISLQDVNGELQFMGKDQIQGIPDVVESIVALGPRLYIACGRFGVRRYVPHNGNLSDITGPIGTSVMSTAIHGFADTFNTDRVVVGTADGQGDIWLSDDSGATWTNTTDNGVNAIPWGGTEELLVFRTHSSWQLGRNNCDVATIQVSPHNPENWVVCSTSAIWTTNNSGEDWQPANGFQILTFRDADTSPTGTIAVGNVDHDALVSNDGGDSWTPIGFGGVTVAHAVEFSPDGTELAIANNERDNNIEGAKLGVASSPDTPSSPNLTELDNPLSPKRTTALAWVTFPGGTQRLITAVDDGGIQTFDRAAGSNTWANRQVRTEEFMESQANGGLRTSVVTDGARNTFIYDRRSGVWRTTNWGVDWTNILPTNAGQDQGYLAYDELRDKLYISTPNQVLRIDDATTSTATQNISFPQSNPGAMALDPCGGLIVYANSLGANNPDTKLFRNDNPSDGGTWIDIADETFKRVTPLVVDMAISADGRIVMPTRGKGILISEPLFNTLPEPDLNLSVSILPNNGITGERPMRVVIDVREVAGDCTDSDEDIFVTLTANPNFNFEWEPSATQIAGESDIENSLWIFDESLSGSGLLVWRRAKDANDRIIPIEGNSISKIGLFGVWDAGASGGESTFTASILNGSGSDLNDANNIDSGVINFRPE